MIPQRLALLRQAMKAHGIDVYYIPTSDDHNSEYTADTYAVRKFFSGFTGSAGTLVVTMDHADLWTDGRYFVQAEDQLKDSTITLRKMGQEGVPTVIEYLKSVLKDGDTIGFDGNVVSTSFFNALKNELKAVHVKYETRYDLSKDIWSDRPGLPNEKYWVLHERYSGVSAKEKLVEIRNKMKETQCDVLLLTALEDVAYTTNLRGHDVACTPVFYGYMLIGQTSATLYCDLTKVDTNVSCYLSENGIIAVDETKLSDDIAKLKKVTLWCDLSSTNVALSTRFDKTISIHDGFTPVTLMRAIKNPTEIKNLRKAHVIDGVAVTRFMYWLKTTIKKQTFTEYEAQEKLEAFRKMGNGFIEPSFTTICAYGANAAMMHYSAPKEGSAMVEPKDFLLVDSGGQYLFGTTDITRTFVMGKTDKEHKKWFTVALKSYLDLMKANFLYGCTGLSLDILARNPVWQYDVDYQCGTGHGVGYVLGVHEGPQAFRWRVSAGRHEDTIFEQGMTITNEPGVYIPHVMGIRHENQMIVMKGNKNEYGQFMHLENLTMCPIDLDGVDVKLLSEEEVNTLNKYHAQVYRALNRYFKGRELAWLKKATRAIHK